MKTANRPNLNAPRFRKTTEGTLNAQFITAIRAKLPYCKDMSPEQIKAVVLAFNGNVWASVIDKRDGVELPEQLGHIFIGSCPAKKSNVDFKASADYMQVIQHRNWESDEYLAKIFYTTYGTKYRFKNHELWGFTATRAFTRTVGKTYPIKWRQYLEVDPKVKISRMYRNDSVRMDKKEVEKELLESYDEFDL
jgi:hypothetical protein